MLSGTPRPTPNLEARLGCQTNIGSDQTIRGVVVSVFHVTPKTFKGALGAVAASSEILLVWIVVRGCKCVIGWAYKELHVWMELPETYLTSSASFHAQL